MKRRKPVLFICVILSLMILLGGCVSKSHWVWKNPEKPTPEAFQKDDEACRILARSEAAQIDYYYDYYYQPFGFPFYAPFSHNRHGYRRPFFNDERYFREQDNRDNFYRICMKAKGWTLTRVEKTQEK